MRFQSRSETSERVEKAEWSANYLRGDGVDMTTEGSGLANSGAMRSYIQTGKG